jgi:hypothetical protein
MASFDVIYQHLPGGTGESHEKSDNIVGLWAGIYTLDLPNTKQNLNAKLRIVLEGTTNLRYSIAKFVCLPV